VYTGVRSWESIKGFVARRIVLANTMQCGSPTLRRSAAGLQSWIAAAVALAVVVGLTALAQPAAAETLKVLHSFKGKKDGGHADAGLVMDKQGTLYGTTSGDNSSFFGTVYKVDSSGKETVLHNFSGGKDGSTPFCDLILDGAGTIYGTTSAGGTDGAGIIFKMDGKGHETVLYNFTGGADGGAPDAGVIRDSAGNLYGTASVGGTSGNGVVYELSRSGKLMVLYTFTGGADGSLPAAPLVRDAAGNLYGTAAEGGASSSGVVFELDTTGKETVLHSFSGGKDGAFPLAGLVRDSSGNLYGTALEGGISENGTVFKVSKAGKFTLLHAFKSRSDGQFPHGGLVRDSTGTLYGTTLQGGKDSLGTIFKVSKTRKETVLYSFHGVKDGQDPLATLLRDSAGNLYGATDGGGALGWGTVFEFKP
jgi:uncharacterized repeat protein (TIGR03803 family)